jgi:hypothetical protein
MGIFLLATGCVAFKVPTAVADPAVGPSDLSRLRSMTAAVAEYKFPVYSQRFAKRLAKTGLFASVILVEDASALLDDPAGPDAILAISRHTYDEPPFDALTFAIHLFGLIPCIEEDCEYGEEFTIAWRSRPDRPSTIDLRGSGLAVITLFALPLSLDPQLSLRDPESSPQYRSRLGAAILQSFAASRDPIPSSASHRGIAILSVQRLNR